MASGILAQGVLTFVFTDIAGSTRLWERAPDAMEIALKRHDEILRSVTAAHRGRVFKTAGDAFCCAFDAPMDAVRATISMQRALCGESWPKKIGNLSVRIGVHTGEAIPSGGDFFGATLNRVARIMAAGSGGQILISASTAALVRDGLEPGVELRDLGSHRLKDLAEPQPLYQVIAHGLPADFAPIASLDAQPNNLPSQISTFVGRDAELSELRELLASSRLVSICGPGGIGKTRIALQLAADTIGRFKDGSWIITLADIDTPRLVPQAIAAALHVQEAPGESLMDTLAHRLSTQQAFLLFDNAEHVLDETARAARRILNACPRVAILVTSREPLHVTGERVVRIGPMADDDAVRLFVDRAQAGKAGAGIENICRKLDGVPLAIELIAARAGTLGTTKELENDLEAIVRRLRSQDPGQEERHRTLYAAVDWSYRLLEPDLRRLFARLAVFEGGFSLEACRAIAADGAAAVALDMLTALIDKSFVTAGSHEGTPRYRLLEPLREFASRRLEESGEGDALSLRHFEYFKALSERWGGWETEEEEHADLAMLATEMPNIRAALEFGLGRSDKAPAFEFLQKIAQYWQQRCNIAEARTWFDRAIALEKGAAPLLRARMLRRAATLATIEDDYPEARRLTQAALDIFETVGDRAGTAEAQHNLAVIEHRSGSAQLARELYERALGGFMETGHAVGQITALYNLGQVSLECGDLSRAKTYLEEGIALCGGSAEHADRFATFLTALGDVSLRRGTTDDAEQYYVRALEMKRNLGNDHDEVEVLRNLAALFIRRGEFARALRYAQESLTIASRLKIDSLFIGCFEVFAVIFMETAQKQRAREALLAAESLRRRIGYVYGVMNELAAEISAIRSDAPGGDEVVGEDAGSRPVDVPRLVEALLQL